MSLLSMPGRAARRAVLWAVAAGAVLSLGTPALAQPLFPSEITQVAPQGFGDRNNSQAWSMAWWNGKLYVGTGRATFCVQQATLQYFKPDSKAYPPKDKDVSCTPDAHDLPLQAEIWRWTPDTNTWDRVYQSPNDVPIPGTTPQKYTARDIGYRGMLVFTEADNTQALYVSGDSTRGGQGVGFDGPVPPPRILRSTDGQTFEPVAFDPDVTLGAPTVSGFRSLKSYKGKLYVVGSVGQLGHGIILEAAHPEQGDFRLISPPGQTYFEIEVYNNFLWAGTGVQPKNDSTPWSLQKTDATGDPYTFTTVIPSGAYRKGKPSPAIISLNVFNNRLYLGSDREVLRVNPDDTWDLVVGTPRKTPDGRQLQPLSGLETGFDNFFNIHMWRMGNYAGWMYVGTQDQSAKWRNLKGGFGAMLKPSMGFDMYTTSDGWHYSAVTRNGLGDLFNNGMRNFASTPLGLFMGTANHFYGTRIYDGVNVPNPAACLPTKSNCAPLRLEVESAGKTALLSWEGSMAATHFHVFRSSGFGAPAEIAIVNPLNPLPPTGGGIYIDQGLKPISTYHYYVVGEDALGQLTEPSNTARVPFKGPVPTFKSLETLLTAWSAPAALTDPLAAAKAAIQPTNCAASDWTTAVGNLTTMAMAVGTPNQTLLLPYRAQDLGILLAKFIRRVTLAQGGMPCKVLMK